MGENATSYALVRPDGKVETFLRLELPANWEPEIGYSIVPDDELPEGWEQYRPDEPVPSTISPRQIRIWLITHGISLAVVEQAIASIPDETQRQIVQVEWEYAPYVERTHPWLEALGEALGLNSAAIDQAFREASVI